MPTISDPGSLLIQKIYEKIDSGLEAKIKVIPGATAFWLLHYLDLLEINLFFGFLPHKRGEKLFLKK